MNQLTLTAYLAGQTEHHTIIDYVIDHLVAQGTPAICLSNHGETACAYRQIDGAVVRSCAVGCLIPDEQYDPSMENMSVAPLLEGFEGFVPEVRPHDYELRVSVLQALQSIHDSHNLGGAFDNVVAPITRASLLALATRRLTRALETASDGSASTSVGGYASALVAERLCLTMVPSP